MASFSQVALKPVGTMCSSRFTMSPSYCSFLAKYLRAARASHTKEGNPDMPRQVGPRKLLWIRAGHAEADTFLFIIRNCLQHPLRHHQHQLLRRGSLSCPSCCSGLALWLKFCCFARCILDSEIPEYFGTCFSLIDEDFLLRFLFLFLCLGSPFLPAFSFTSSQTQQPFHAI